MFDGKKLVEKIKAESKLRRSNPLNHFNEVLSSYWQENSVQDTMLHWLLTIDQYPWNADDALYCINHVLNNPPIDLIDRLSKFGWISFEHEKKNNKPFSSEEYLQWLKYIYFLFNQQRQNPPSNRGDWNQICQEFELKMQAIQIEY